MRTPNTNSVKFNECLAEKVKSKRKELGVTQCAMARLMYIHPNTYGSRERGETRFTADEFVWLCRLYRWDLEEVARNCEKGETE
jgi:transcriptional regulator with XRE-family HTH domain